MKKKKAKKKATVVKHSRKIITRPVQNEVMALVLDKKEDELVMLEGSGAVANTLGYQIFKTITDKETGRREKKLVGTELTYVGFRELARTLKMRIKYGEPKEVYMPENKMWVVRVEATNLSTGENVWGGAEVGSEFQGGKENFFPYRMALVKAQRNALKQLIPLMDRLRILGFWERTRKGKFIEVSADKEEVRKALPEKAQQNDVFASIFAKITELKLPTKEMHQYLRDAYRVDHLRSLSKEKLEEIRKTLVMYSKDEMKLADLKAKMDEYKTSGKEV